MLQPDLANTFYYKSKLFRGFKYRYYFNVGDTFVVDSGREISEDRLGKMTNSVDVPTKQAEADAEKAKAAAEVEAEQEGLEDALADLENDDEAEEEKKEESPVQPGPPNMHAFLRYPSYVSKEMKNVLPAEVQQKQGERVMDDK